VFIEQGWLLAIDGVPCTRGRPEQGKGRRMKKVVLLMSLVAALPYCSSATAIWTENFNYPDGALTNVSLGVWTTFSGTANQIMVSGNKVVGMAAGAGSREDSARNLDATYTTGVLFAGFDLTLATTPATSAYFAHFKDNTTSGFRGRVFLGAPTTAGFRIGLETDGGDAGATTVFTGDLTLGTTYRVVLAYDTAAGTSKLWVNNVNEGSPTLQDTVAATLLGMSAFALRQGGSATATYSGLDIDRLITATDFQTALLIPEPSSTALLLLGGLGGLGFLMMRRKK
jgi:hypothetical protein